MLHSYIIRCKHDGFNYLSFINVRHQLILLFSNDEVILHGKGCDADHLMNCKLFIVDN